MAGHSKWANIKHKKDRADAKKGKIFSRITKEIISAVKLDGPDPQANPRLRLAVQKAKAANMPNENVERNIKKASGGDGADYTEITYEIYGHGGVGIIVEIMTDNKNRIASEIRIATNKRGGTIASPGSVAFNFDRKGVIYVPKKDASEEELFAAATFANAEDFEEAEDSYVILTSPDSLYNVKEELDKKNFTCEDVGIEMIPKTYVECNEEDFKANTALIEWLEELDDVDTTYNNMQQK